MFRLLPELHLLIHRSPEWAAIHGVARAAPAVLLACLVLTACSGEGEVAPGPHVEGAAIGVEGAHEHGVVRMGFAVDAWTLTLNVQAPADAVFGFEHAPTTDEEWGMVSQALTRLRADAGALVALSDELRCDVERVEVVDAPEMEGADHDDDGDEHDHEAEHEDHDHEAEHEDDDHDHEAEGGQHSEVRFTVVWTCAVSPEGTPATLRLRDVLPDVAVVDLTVITSQGQAGARVAADAAFRF